MDKFEDTVVNPNISLKNIEMKILDNVQERPTPERYISTGRTEKTTTDYKSLLLLVLLIGIIIYQVYPYFS